MSKFLDYLNDICVNLNTESFKECLKDEEFIEDNLLTSCYYCEGISFDIIKSGVDCYDYLGNLMNKYSTDVNNNLYNIHLFGLLCNWFHSKGIPVFKDAQEYPNLSILICNDCGKIVGVKLDNFLDWEYPYLKFPLKENKTYKLHNLSDLVKESFEILNISEKETLECIQCLYEKNYITYPRTSNQYLDSSIKNRYNEILMTISKMPELEIIANNIKKNVNSSNNISNLEKYINDKKYNIERRLPIIPKNSILNINDLTKIEYEILLLIYKKFLSIFY